MLRKLGKHILLVSIPLFVLLLIYRNQSHLAKRDSPATEGTHQNVATRSMFTLTHHGGHSKRPVSGRARSKSTYEWRVLPDGTVVHQGTESQGRNISIVLDNTIQCASLRANQSSFVVLVESDIVNFQERQLIRDTWALRVLQQIANYRVIFLVGLSHDAQVQNKLNFENLIYEDIVQIGVQEDFQNLTYKSIHMLHWYTTSCTKAQYLFKTDDDIYLHIPNILDMLHTSSGIHIDMERAILCHRNKSRKILRSLSDIHHFLYSLKERNKQEAAKQIRKKFRKYLMSYDTLPGTLYPDYCSGFGYMMNQDVAQKLLEVSSKIPYIGIEDVFITGFCRQKSNLTIVDNGLFKLKPIIQPIESKCAFDTGRVTSNEMSVDEIRKLWVHVNTQGYYCKLSANDSSSK